MKSELKWGAFLSYVVLLLNNLVGLLYTPFLLRMLGKSEYGLYSISASIIAYLTILDFGFGNAIVRYTAKYRAEGKKEEQYKAFGFFFILYCAIGVIALVLGLCVAFHTNVFFDKSMTMMEVSRLKIIIFLMLANLAVTFPLSLFTSIISAYERFVFQKVIIIVRVLLNTLTMVVLLQFGYKAIALAVVASIFNIATLVSNCIYCFVKLKIKLYFARIEYSVIKEIVMYSFWMFLNAIIDRIYWSTGQFVLGAVAGTASVAIFAVSIQLEHMYMSFSTAVTSVFLPKVTSIVTKNANSEYEVSELFIKTGRIQYCVMALILSGFFLFGRSFVTIWAGPDYAESYIIAMIFFVPLMIPLIQTLGITILQARNQMKFRSLLYIFISLLSLGFQIPLSKKYGGIGCACAISGALVLGQVITMNVYYQVRQKINIMKFWFEIAKMSVVPLAMTVMTYAILRNVNFQSPAELVVGIGLYLILYLPLFFVFSMNSYERGLVVNPVKKIIKITRRI